MATLFPPSSKPTAIVRRRSNGFGAVRLLDSAFGCLEQPSPPVVTPVERIDWMSRNGTVHSMGYIGVHGINALHKYKYSGVDHSYVAKYVLQPFWSRFVTFFPLWMP
ncbi:hypothetical protein LXL04_035611 [Taraxacum kok-saghyz]